MRQLCWETMFGQELVKLTVMDTIFMLMSIFIVDFLRSIFLRAFNPYWFWDMEKKFPKYPDFKVTDVTRMHQNSFLRILIPVFHHSLVLRSRRMYCIWSTIKA